MRNKIIEGDCIKVMEDLWGNSVDCIITDTPYGIKYESKNSVKRIFEPILNDDNLDFFQPFLKQAYRVLKENSCIFLFCRYDNYPIFYNWVKEAGFNVKNCLIWEKSKALGGLGDLESSFKVNYEFVIFATKGRKILFKKGIGRTHGLIKDDSINSPSKLLYPTQKPLKILRKLIKLTTNEGDLVLDAFCGSGSTCLAAKQMKRDYLGIDLNPKAVEISNKRLNQTSLFNFGGFKDDER